MLFKMSYSLCRWGNCSEYQVVTGVQVLHLWITSHISGSINQSTCILVMLHNITRTFSINVSWPISKCLKVTLNKGLPTVIRMCRYTACYHYDYKQQYVNCSSSCLIQFWNSVLDINVIWCVYVCVFLYNSCMVFYEWCLH